MHPTTTCWFFTWRTYGTWLPGEDGFVGYYKSSDGRRVIDNARGQPTAKAIPLLANYAAGLLTHDPVELNHTCADVIRDELLRTTSFRKWKAEAIAVICNHVHFAFHAPSEREPEDLLGELKSYCSRALNRIETKPKGWWWAGGGSTQPVKTDENRRAVIRYIREQEGALIVWVSDEAQQLLAARQSVEVPAVTPALAGGVRRGI
jgi:hypothetical protein